MSYRRCAVPSCGRYQQKSKDDFAFFVFPTEEKQPERRKRWIELLDLDEQGIGKDPRICGRHFDQKYAKCRRLPADIDPLKVTSAEHPMEAEDAIPVEQILMDQPSTTPKGSIRSRIFAPFASASSGNILSQSSSASAGTTDKSFKYESPLGESILAKCFKNSDETTPKENYLPKDDQRNYIVSERQLRLLLRRCSTCGANCGEAFANGFGVDVEFLVECSQCHELNRWTTQPELSNSRVRSGTLMTTASVLLAGKTFTDLRKISENMHLKIMSEGTFYNYAKAFVYPLIDETFARRHQILLEELKQKQDADQSSALTIGVDCRFSRPGYTATVGITSAMDLDSKRIVATSVKSKTDIDVSSSSAMETVGTRAVIKAIIDPTSEDHEPLALLQKREQSAIDAERGEKDDEVNIDDSPDFYLPEPPSSIPSIPLRIGLVISDENKAVEAMIRNEFKDAFVHQADPWHLRKSIMKKISKLARLKSNALLVPWIPSIRNWLWTSMKECSGDPDYLVELWRSILFHITGRHSWQDDESFTKFQKCSHRDLSTIATGYLPIDSDAFHALTTIIEDERIHQRLRRCTSFRHTSNLESFHSLLCKYLPKDRKFIGSSFETRTKMAVLDWNENIGRPDQTDKDGNKMVTYEHPAAAAAWRARYLRSKRMTDWSTAILTDLGDYAMSRVASGTTVHQRSIVITHLPLVSMYEPVDKEMAVDQQKSHV